MKKLIFLLFTLCTCLELFSQAPQSINYQAIAWNNDNTPRANQLIRVKISILNQSANGPEVFNEEYQVTTNNQGLFTLEIGSLNLNDFQKINWGNGAKFLQVSIDGILIGTTKMLSVPYALYAESTNLKAGTGIGVSGNTITNTGDLDNINEIQTLNLNGSQLSLSKNGGTVLLPTSGGGGTTYTAGTGISINPTNVISTDLKAGEGIAIAGNTISNTNPGGGTTYTAGTGIAIDGSNKITATSGAPAGSIMAYGGATPPDGWLLCDGTTVSSSKYPELFAAIGTNWGSGSSGTFKLPDLRGMFLRGVASTSIDDPEKEARISRNGSNSKNQVGSYQDDQFQGHYHQKDAVLYLIKKNGGVNGVQEIGSGFTYNNPEIKYPVTDGVNGEPRFGSETRPKNVYVLYIIKY